MGIDPDWGNHPLNVQYREGVKRLVAEDAQRTKDRSLPSNEDRAATNTRIALGLLERAQGQHASPHRAKAIEALKDMFGKGGDA